jgi:uncharacterized protein (DUF736 family)
VQGAIHDGAKKKTMDGYDNNMRGVLFRAEKKNDKAPDYTGNCEIEGVEIRLAGWVRTAKSGKKFLSLALSYPQNCEAKLVRELRELPYPADTTPNEAIATAEKPVDDDDELPF